MRTTTAAAPSHWQLPHQQHVYNPSTRDNSDLAKDYTKNTTTTTPLPRTTGNVFLSPWHAVARSYKNKYILWPVSKEGVRRLRLEGGNGGGEIFPWTIEKARSHVTVTRYQNQNGRVQPVNQPSRRSASPLPSFESVLLFTNDYGSKIVTNNRSTIVKKGDRQKG